MHLHLCAAPALLTSFGDRRRGRVGVCQRGQREGGEGKGRCGQQLRAALLLALRLGGQRLAGVLPGGGLRRVAASRGGEGG